MASLSFVDESNLSKLCRACLGVEGDMKSMFTSFLTSTEISLDCIFESITSLKLIQRDGLSDLICNACESRLVNSFLFREQCQRSYVTLKKYIEESEVVKTENIQPKNECNESDSLYNCSSDLDNDVTAGNTNIQVDQYPPEVVDEKYIEELTVVKTENVQPSNESNESNSLYNCSNDLDNKVITGNTNVKANQYPPEVVNKAVLKYKEKLNEKRDCHVCGFISSSVRGLSLHISHLHKELKNRWCSMCYTEVDDLAEHIKEHAKQRSFTCVFCGKGFSTQSHLTEHLYSHSLERPHKCGVCGKGFLSARHLRVHNRIHSGEKPYSCLHCERKFTQKGSLKTHLKTHSGIRPTIVRNVGNHLQVDRQLINTKLDTWKTALKKKISMELKSDATPNENITTDEILTSDKKKKKKINSENKEDDKRLCTVCGKIFKSSPKLRVHMRVHTREMPYGCSYCDKRFCTRGQLVVHIRTHTGEKPHVCHVCGKAFSQSSVLNTHMKLHTGRPEVCAICQQRFCRPAELRIHMRKHTGEKPYFCEKCGQSFVQKSHLVEHTKTHSDVRPYQCTYCDSAFKQSSSLKSHVQIHTGQKPYQCSQCAYACRQPYSLTQHMRRQHSNDSPRSERPHLCLVCQRSFTTVAMLTSHGRTVHEAHFSTN